MSRRRFLKIVCREEMMITQQTVSANGAKYSKMTAIAVSIPMLAGVGTGTHDVQ